MHSSEIHSGLFSPTVETVGSAPEGKRDKPDLYISQPWATGSSAHCWGSLCPPAAGAEQGHCSRRGCRTGQDGRGGRRESTPPEHPPGCFPVSLDRCWWRGMLGVTGSPAWSPKEVHLELAPCAWHQSPCPRWSCLAPSSAWFLLYWCLKSCLHCGRADSICRLWPGNSTRLIGKQWVSSGGSGCHPPSAAGTKVQVPVRWLSTHQGCGRELMPWCWRLASKTKVKSCRLLWLRIELLHC